MVLPALQAVVDPNPTTTAATTLTPSSDFVLQALNGDPGAWLLVAGAVALRAGLIAAGLWLIDRDDKKVIEKAFAASAVVEVFVIGYTWNKAQQAQAQKTIMGSVVVAPTTSATAPTLTPVVR